MAHPGIPVPVPPGKHDAGALPVGSLQGRQQGNNDVGGQGVHQFGGLRSSDEALKAGQVGVPQQCHP